MRDVRKRSAQNSGELLNRRCDALQTNAADLRACASTALENFKDEVPSDSSVLGRHVIGKSRVRRAPQALAQHEFRGRGSPLT